MCEPHAEMRLIKKNNKKINKINKLIKIFRSAADTWLRKDYYGKHIPKTSDFFQLLFLCSCRYHNEYEVLLCAHLQIDNALTFKFWYRQTLSLCVFSFSFSFFFSIIFTSCSLLSLIYNGEREAVDKRGEQGDRVSGHTL